MADWPNQLPDYLMIDGASGTYGDNLVRSQPEVGPEKIRRRSTAMPDIFYGSQYLTSTQMGYLKTFYKTTVASGSLSFNWKDPITRSACVMTFAAPPVYTPLGGVEWRVDYAFKILP